MYMGGHSCAMKQHKEEDWARWRGLVSEQVESGRSVAPFCRERCLRDWQFYEWKKRLREAEAAPFVAVEVARSDAPTRPVPMQMFVIEIRHRRGWSLVVEPVLDASHLRRLLSVLELES
jgi:hypothetical protein